MLLQGLLFVLFVQVFFVPLEQYPIERNTLRTVINDGLPFSDKEV